MPIYLPLWRCIGGCIHHDDEPITDDTHLTADAFEGHSGQLFGALHVPKNVAKALSEYAVKWEKH